MNCGVKTELVWSVKPGLACGLAYSKCFWSFSVKITLFFNIRSRNSVEKLLDFEIAAFFCHQHSEGKKAAIPKSRSFSTELCHSYIDCALASFWLTESLKFVAQWSNCLRYDGQKCYFQQFFMAFCLVVAQCSLIDPFRIDYQKLLHTNEMIKSSNVRWCTVRVRQNIF